MPRESTPERLRIDLTDVYQGEGTYVQFIFREDPDDPDSDEDVTGWTAICTVRDRTGVKGIFTHDGTASAAGGKIDLTSNPGTGRIIFNSTWTAARTAGNYSWDVFMFPDDGNEPFTPAGGTIGIAQGSTRP